METNPFTDLEQKLDNLTYMVSELTHLIKNLSPPQYDRPLNITEATEYLKISKATMYKLTSHRSIPHFKKGQRVYFYISELDKWVRAGRQKTVEEIKSEA